jgi:hypothetical protein
MLEATAAYEDDRTEARRPAIPRPIPENGRRDHLTRLAALSLVGLGRRLTSDPEAEREATDLARAWLTLVDEGRYAASRAATTDALRDAIDQDDWLTALRSARAPLGPCLSRELGSRGLFALPGDAGPGWAVIRFLSCFERKCQVTETVAASQEADGRWRVAAYFVGDPADP